MIKKNSPSDVSDHNSNEFAAVLSRPFAIDDLSDGPLQRSVVATADECEAIAHYFDIPRLESLKADLHISQLAGQVRVTGTLKARVTQKCVVSLELFDSDVTDDIEIDFADPSYVARAEEAWSKRIEDEDDVTDALEPPDPIINGSIDLGAIVVEFLVLGLDPYPRKEGAVFEAADDSGDEKASPFAALAQLKDQNSHS